MSGQPEGITFGWLRAVREAPHDVLPFGTRGVLGILSTYMDADGGNCFPSLETLAEACNLAPRTVSLHLKPALDAAYLRRASGSKRGGKRSTQYFPLFPTRAARCSGRADGTEGSETRPEQPAAQVEQPAAVERPEQPAAAEQPAADDLSSPLLTTNTGPTQGNPAKKGTSSRGTSHAREADDQTEQQATAPASALETETETDDGWPMVAEPGSKTVDRRCHVCDLDVDSRLWASGDRTHTSCDPVEFHTSDAFAVGVR